jgi:hypothetical protein
MTGHPNGCRRTMPGKPIAGMISMRENTLLKHFPIPVPRALCVTLPAFALTVLLIGCGGGGGGGSTAAPFGRSYLFTASGQTFSLSMDALGRFTFFVRDASKLPGGGGGQGIAAVNGQLTATSDDGTLLLNGSVSGDANVFTGSVQLNGSALLPQFTAPATTLLTTPSGLPGTYKGASGSDAAFLTVDALTSHATLWARIGGLTGGAPLSVSANGAMQSADGGTAAQLTLSQSVYTLQVTRLNGQNVNGQFTLTRITRARWTFLVFMNAANNLQPFSGPNVTQMENIGSTTSVNIVIQWKQAQCAPGVDCGSPSWFGTRRYFVTKNGLQLVQDMGQNIDMGSWQELRNFIVWTQQNYPADHYALVLWDHGAGWKRTRAVRAVSQDMSTNHEIQTWELPQALSVTPQMDMVIFDASLMQMAEVAYEIRNSAQVMVGSEESPPGEGYFYDSFLADLVSNPSMTAAQFGTQIVNRTLEAYTQAFGATDSRTLDVTQSAIDLTKMQGVADRLNVFADSLILHLGDSRTALMNARLNAEAYGHGDPFYSDYKDLWDYCDNVKATVQPADLVAAASGVQQALSAAIIANTDGAGHPRSHGQAIYVPPASGYDSNYANLALSRVTDWGKWIQQSP